MKRRHRGRIRKESRTIPLYGDRERGNGLDDGRYYRCWNCGFICNVDRDALGGPESGDGKSYEAFLIPTDPSLNSVSRLGGSEEPSTVSLALDIAGDTITETHAIQSVINQGCPFCGTLNWRGDY